MDYDRESLKQHKKIKGKITLGLKDHLDSKEKLSVYYTPGVAAVSKKIAANPGVLRDYSWTNNLVAVVSDGSAVLGLGKIGPEAAMPVMEGKAMLFKHFAGVDAVPIVLNAHSADEIVNTVRAIAPSFGGINLEDIAAPICFEVEERLKNELPIPVMHDDQHGTAIVVLAGLINACKVTNRDLSKCKIVLIGAGAAGVAIAKLLHLYASPQIVCVDSKGAITSSRTDLTPEKLILSQFAADSSAASVQDALKDADIVVGVSRGNLLDTDDIKTMAPNPIVFALANPTPEIMPDIAKSAGAAVVATGRSDFANQVNNALVFPGVFRGALDNKVVAITDQHKISAAEAIAAFIPKPTADKIIPSVFEPGLAAAVAAKIK